MSLLTQSCVPPKTALLASESPPSVHTSETTVPNASQAIDRPDRAILQKARQSSAKDLYSHVDFGHDKDRSEDIVKCHKIAWFARHKETGLVRLCFDSCKLRWCPLCSSSRIRWITWKVSEWLVTLDRPKFITFTIRHSDADLDWQLKCLSRFFRSIRRRRGFTRYVRGGIWFFQIKKSEKDGLWHNHFHCVVDSSYFPQDELSDMWNRVTHGSRIVDIRIIRNPGKAANEVARYAACPCDLSKNTLEDNVTLYHALHGKRICGTWGTAKGVPLKPPKCLDYKLWENVGSKSIVLEFRNSDRNARAILEAYQNNTPLDADVAMKFTDKVVEIEDGFRRAVLENDYERT